MRHKIQMIDLAAEYQLLKPALQPKINKALENGNYIQGIEVREFEQELANFLNIKHVISCGNGTDALQIALMAIDIKVGDEVIIPAFSYVAVAEVLCLLGATPVFVDVDQKYFQLDNELVKKAITKKTRAIIPVHLFGQCGDMETLLNIAERHKISVIEDTAQALGASCQISGTHKYLGGLGKIGCTSFFPTKNLSCFGDGGAVFTNDDDLAKKIRMIANHGQAAKYNHQIMGINSRLDTLQAVVLSEKLKHLKDNLSSKKAIANWYHHQLRSVSQIELPLVFENINHTWHQFTIKIKEGKRDNLKLYLKEKGIDAMVYYPMPLAKQNAYSNFRTLTPIADFLCKSVLSLPIHPLLKEKEITYICGTIKEFFNVR
ncbi:DegT/DnrJ/EryC1/StrS family aminotransferase [Pedobacter sp. SD-b]|uniref:DegT/DnrJ/EryC1/StrS family aminotransferase n=1 Tax=Pedobacter segetis TaxID=2793069 RepID=A0ABS1BP96_9SPHI|nr:DegT/DnrJ/EryC1/StrS family aminotransferase [Pedobacter segetis]MBK0384084.1 DegT/DnrJ/EryC1/StrS family aminotransferase [Pedobacter segetis]